MAVSINTERRAVEVRWDPGDDPDVTEVQVFATGAAGDVHNTAVMPNDGLCAVSYPSDFAGTSEVEVRDLDGNVVDSGTIEVA